MNIERIGLKIKGSNECPFCFKGEVPVCGWCEEGALHSHCDDTYHATCDYCNGTGIDPNDKTHDE